MNNSASKHLIGLDLIRFSAASLVMIYHFAFFSWTNPAGRGTPGEQVFAVYEPLAPWIGTGWIGVQVFFVISGFVISLTANGRSPLAFVQSRFLRLWPALTVCAILSVVIRWGDGTPHLQILRRFLCSLILWPRGPWLAGPYWTLPVELIFYLLIFTIMVVGKSARLEQCAAGLGLISTSIWVLYLLAGHSSPAWPARALAFLGNAQLCKLLLLQHGCFFALGVLGWVATARGLTWPRLVTMLAIIGGCLLQIIAETTKANQWNGYPSQAATPVAIWCGAMLLLAASIRYNAKFDRVGARFARTVRTLGLSTYPLYLIHQPIGETLMPRLFGLGLGPAWVLAVPVGLAVATAWFIALVAEPAMRRAFIVLVERCSRHVARDSRLRRPTEALSPSLPGLPQQAMAAETPP